MSLCKTLMAAAAVAMVGAVSTADAMAEKVFRYATTGDILGLDPHANNEGPTNTMKSNIYGRLVHRTADLSLEPDLSTGWEKLDDVTWRFKLREGVTFHNGSPFNADDVVYSFKRQTQETSEMAFALATVKEIRKIDDYTVEIETKGPDPILLLNMPNFYIVDMEWTEENNAFEVVRASGTTNFANTHANGTGPFKLVEWIQDTKLVLEPNTSWWNQANRTDNIDKAVFTPISNNATRVAALLSGEIDMMYPVPLQDVRRLNNDENVSALEGPELRTIFFGFDQERPELLDMPGSGKNPFLDVRVRKAVYQAIDINAIKRAVMRNAATPTALMIAPGINGFQEDMNDRFPYDPEASKKLLAEAGWGDGFSFTLDCPNDRYVNDEKICTAVVPMLERIGLKVTLNAQTKSLHFNKIGKAQGYNTSMYMLGWTPGSYDALNPLHQLLSKGEEGRGTWNSGRYTNPRVEELVGMIETEMDETKRNAQIREAFALVKEDVATIPLHQQALAWGVRNDTVESIVQRPFNDVDLRYVVMK